MSESPHRLVPRTRRLRAEMDGEGNLALAVGRRISALRERRGLRQAKLAKLSGVPASSISHIERGFRLPSVASLLAIAKVLGSTTDAMLGHRQLRKPRP